MFKEERQYKQTAALLTFNYKLKDYYRIDELSGCI